MVMEIEESIDYKGPSMTPRMRWVFLLRLKMVGKEEIAVKSPHLNSCSSVNANVNGQ